ncbi:MAG: trypsin-like serine peptidase [Planctomycetota bacterium]|jgi:hypothetical protein
MLSRLPWPLAAAFCATPVLAQDLPLTEVDVLRFSSYDYQAVNKEDIEREAAGQPWRFAIPHDVAIGLEQRGTWETATNGDVVWRLRVAAEAARTINLGFTQFFLPESATLTVEGVHGTSRIRPFTHLDNDGHRQLWTPVVLDDEVVIQLTVAPEELGDVSLLLGRVGQGYRGFGYKTAGPQLVSGSCNVDVVCPEGDPWALEIPAVVALQYNGFLNCSGSMVNDTQDSLTPYMLTADHCGLSVGAAPTLVTYFNYQNSFCRTPGSAASGGPGDGQFNQFVTGSIHRADYGPSDFTLVELDDDPDPAWNISYLGWNRGTGDSANATAIHHPGVEEKRISFENDPTTTTAYLGTASPGDGTHVRVEDWDLGTTEGGSSGSPLFDENKRVIGQLHGGFASCSSQTADWYGRVNVSWLGGGSAGSRLADWLDPTQTGAVTTDTISLNTLCSDDGTVEFLEDLTNCNGVATVRIVDCGLNQNPLAVETIFVQVISTSDPIGVSVQLTETSVGSGRFEGTVDLSSFPSGSQLGVQSGDVITATYVDADDGLGGFGIVKTADLNTDCDAPTVIGVSTVAVSSFGAQIQVVSDEPVNVTVEFGSQCGSFSFSADGPSSASTSNLVQVTGLQPLSGYAYRVVATDLGGNVVIDDASGGCYSFITPNVPPSFTEQFSGDYDLNGQSMTFTPTSGPDGFFVCIEPTVGLPTDPTGSAPLSLSDDDSVSVSLGGSSFPFFGGSYGSVFVGSNGYLTFGSGDTDYDETLDEHFSLPRISALYDDLDPSNSGLVGSKLLADRAAITYFDIPEYNSSNSNTFQVELFFDGRVRITWLQVQSTDSVIGLSAGAGSTGLAEQDLSASDDCASGLCQTDLGFGVPGGALLTVCGGDLSSGNDADLSVVNGPAGGQVVIAASTSANPIFFPQFGGTVLTNPLLFTVALPLDGAGSVVAPIAGGGGPLTLVLQGLTVGGPSVELTNGVQIEILP